MKYKVLADHLKQKSEEGNPEELNAIEKFVYDSIPRNEDQTVDYYNLGRKIVSEFEKALNAEKIDVSFSAIPNYFAKSILDSKNGVVQKNARAGKLVEGLLDQAIVSEKVLSFVTGLCDLKL